MKKVLLVNPFGVEQDGFFSPPIGLLYLTGTLLGEGFEVRVVDCCLEGRGSLRQALKEFRPGIVGITCMTPGRRGALEAAQTVKDLSPKTPVVLGGVHPTIMYNQMMEHYPGLDYIVLGEGERTFLELAQGKDPAQINGLVYRHNAKVVKTAVRRYIDNLDDIPFPAWQLVDLKRYPPRGSGTIRGINLARQARVPVIFSRGCKGHCNFCSTWWIWQGWRHRSPKNMADEIEWLYRDFGARHFCFADDAMTVDREATLGLCNEIIARRLNIAFHVTTRTDCVDEAMLRALKEVGCYNIAFGIETGSPLLLEKIGKENDIAKSEQAIRLCKKVGLRVTALMIIGNVGETAETIDQTVSFLRRAQPDEVGHVGGLWILPGTQLYQHCRSQGIIDDDFWLTDEPYMVYTKEHSLQDLGRMQRMVSSCAYRPIHQKIIGKIRSILK